VSEVSTAELQLLLTAKDLASATLRAFAGIISGAVIGSLADMARAAAADEANLLKLRVAVENSGAVWEYNVDVINERIRAGQDLAFTDTQVRDSLGALTQTTGNFATALDLQMLAMDLARAKTMDLTTASELVGKVAQGNTGILARYGIVLKDHATAAQGLAALQETFGGQAEAYGTTNEAAIVKTKNAIDEFKESIGAAMGPVAQFLALLPGVSAGFSAVTAALTFLIPAQTAAGAATAAALWPWEIVIATVALVVIALYEVVETLWVVVDNWDLFVEAFKTGKLSEIPVLGFFFLQAQRVLAAIDAIGNAWNGLTSLLGSSPVPEAEIPSFAEGGIVPGPLGSPQMVIAHGGEPIGYGAGAGGAGGGMTVNVNVAGSVWSSGDLAQEIETAVRNGVQRGGFRGVLGLAS
jgi:hypothetical protein